jgi:hypothetical protein
MEQNQIAEIKEIIAESDCSKDCECFKDGFKDLCKAKWQGKYTDCLEPGSCTYKSGVLFGSGSICQCKLRVYVAKNLRKLQPL